MFRVTCGWACEHKVSKGVHNDGYCMHDVQPWVCSPRGCWPTPKGRKVCLVSPSMSLIVLLCFRYANVDYVVVRSVQHNPEPKKIASYDIMCQWSMNLQRQLLEFLLEGVEHLDDKIIAQMVPKFYLAAHCQECCTNDSLNYEPSTGRRDMEGPKWTWFRLQGGGSTKDQGPGYWSNAMDDKFSHWNWSKLVHLGVYPAHYPLILNIWYLMLIQAHFWPRSTWMQSTKPSCVKKSWTWLTTIYPSCSYICGRRWSWHGRKIGALQTHTIHL